MSGLIYLASALILGFIFLAYAINNIRPWTLFFCAFKVLDKVFSFAYANHG
jgi:hypothetical protein